MCFLTWWFFVSILGNGIWITEVVWHCPIHPRRDVLSSGKVEMLWYHLIFWQQCLLCHSKFLLYCTQPLWMTFTYMCTIFPQGLTLHYAPTRENFLTHSNENFCCLLFPWYREEEMQDLNRETDRRMFTFIFCSIIICLSVAGMQLWHLKIFFERKKLL